MLTLDTSAVLALINTADSSHQVIRDTLASEQHPYVIPVGLLSELCYMVEVRLGLGSLHDLLTSLRNGDFELDCGEGDIARIQSLLRSYEDLALGYADAAVIACAERRGSSVLTLDRRDFDPVARAGVISVLP